jgi:hypothetical protein
MNKDNILGVIKKHVILVLVILFALLVAIWLYLSKYASKATMHTPYE